MSFSVKQMKLVWSLLRIRSPPNLTFSFPGPIINPSLSPEPTLADFVVSSFPQHIPPKHL